MKRWCWAFGSVCFLAACALQGPQGSDDDAATSDDDDGHTGNNPADPGTSGSTSTGSGGPTGPGSGGGTDPDANADGDCMTDAEELALGTDPNQIDSDGDGISDCDELDCVSDPTDTTETCYACGWQHNDPGTIQSTGSSVGSVIKDVLLPDQCGEQVSLYDFTGGYHILYMTAAW